MSKFLNDIKLLFIAFQKEIIFRPSKGLCSKARKQKALQKTFLELLQLSFLLFSFHFAKFPFNTHLITLP